MGRSGVLRRSATAMVCAMTAATIGAWSHGADAFALKHTSHGQPLRWGVSQLSYVVDPSVEEAVTGGNYAVSSALSGWSQAAGGPTLSAAAGTGDAKPGLDGQNTVLFAPHGFAPAGGALAVTVTSYEESSGTIVDSDIVINGTHAFAVLAAGAKPDGETKPIATDGSTEEDSAHRSAPSDLVHVLAHEIGHTLGLADESDNRSTVMYAFTTPGDASMRLPSSDDIDGMTALYGATSPGPSAGTSRAGCAVAGSKTGPEDVWGALALIAGACLWLAARHRVKAARVLVPFAAAVLALVACPDPARSAAPPAAFASDSIARVIGASTRNVAGLFETTLDLTPLACRRGSCPARAQAHVWGGTMNGITQRVGDSVPNVGEVVDIAFLQTRGTHVQLATVVLLGNHH